MIFFNSVEICLVNLHAISGFDYNAVYPVFLVCKRPICIYTLFMLILPYYNVEFCVTVPMGSTTWCLCMLCHNLLYIAIYASIRLTRD